MLMLALVGCVLLSGCNISIVGGYSFNFTGEKVDKSESGSFAEGIQLIKVENQFGDIKVVSDAEGEAGWQWDASCWGDSVELAEIGLEDTFLDIQTEGQIQTWTLIMPEEMSDINGVKSDFTFRVPTGIDVSFINSHGNIEADSLDSNFTSNNSHGNVSLTNMKGNNLVKNNHGDVTAQNIGSSEFTVNHGKSTIESATGQLKFQGSHGRVSIDTVDGDLEVGCGHTDIEVRRVTQNAKVKTNHDSIEITGVIGNLVVENSHGKISVTDVIGDVTASNQHSDTNITTASENVSVTSQHGDVKIRNENPDFKEITASTSHDEIELILPGVESAAIEMKTTHGDTKSEVDSQDSSPQKVSLTNRHGDIKIKN